MNKFTIKELKRKIENIPDDTVISIERIKDENFDKENGWETDYITFKDNRGIIIDEHEFLDSFSAIYSKEKKRLIIVANY